MGIYQIIKNASIGIAGIWEITETEQELFLKANITDDERIYLSNIKAENRRKEWLASRVLLNELMERPCRIDYEETGKPFIQNQQVFISISHTSGFAAVSLNFKEETGIDIQSKGHKISRIRHKFLCNEELEAISKDDEEEKLIIHWCAKEALYKLYGKKEVIFKSDLFIEPFELKKEGELIGSIKKGDFIKNYLLSYSSFADFVLVWVKQEV
jgi:4'-phosphopantetheinyl transferase